MGGNGSEELRKHPPPSSAVLWFVNVCEKKTQIEKKEDKIVSLTKSKLNRIEVLISKSLIDSNNNDMTNLFW